MSILKPEILLLIPLILLFVNKKNLFFVLSAMFLVIGLSEIVKIETKKVKFANNDIFLVIDTTYSMACEDLKPSRLEFAKKEVIKFIKRVNNPIGLVVFNKSVNILSLPTSDKEFLIQQIKTLKVMKSRTDIQMAINKVKSLNPKSKIILISDGGENYISGNFIFWGFATKKGAKVPGFKAISRLNIIGKYFRYDELDKLLKYLNKNKSYTTKEVKIYKPISYIFVVLAFVFFLIGIIVNRFAILMVLVFLYPHTLKANDLMGCIYEYVGLKKAAFNEFKKGDSEFAKIKVAIYYLKKDEFQKALKSLKNTNSDKAKYIEALIFTKLKKYQKAYEIMKDIPLDKEKVKLFKFLKKYQKQTSTIYPQIHNQQKSQKNIMTGKKEHLW